MSARETLTRISKAVARWLAAALASFTRTERIVFAVATIAFAAVHLWHQAPQFGEDDQARFAFDAVSWHLRDTVDFKTTDYRMRTSPLYVHSLKRMLDLGLPIASLPKLMSHVSFVSSGVVLAVMYLLFRPLAGRAASGLACGLYWVTPAAWLGASYGMAHVPALAFWLVALLIFSSAMDEGVRRAGYLLRLGVALLCAWVALSLKADLVLTGLAFPGLVLVKRKLSFGNVAAACAVVLVSLGFQLLYSRGIVAAEAAVEVATKGHEPVHDFLARWHKRFPFEVRALTHLENVAAVTNAPGKLLYFVSLVALLAALVGRGTARMGVWAAAWSLPLVVFWVLIIGNSVRHNLAALPPLMLLVAQVLLRLAETRLRVGLLFAGVVAVNYVSDVTGAAAGHGTMAPRTDLLALSRSVNEKSRRHAKLAAEFAALPSPRKGGVERFFLAYEQFAVAAEGQKAGRVSFDGTDLRITRRGGAVQTVRLTYAANAGQARQASQKMRSAGFDVFSTDYRMREPAAPAAR